VDQEFEQWVERKFGAQAKRMNSLEARIKRLEETHAEQWRAERAAALPVSLIQRPGIGVLRQLREED